MRATFLTKIMLLQSLVVAVVLTVVIGIAATQQRATLEDQFEQRALAIARTVASVGGLGEAVNASNTAEVSQLVNKVGPRADALFVVITDEHGIRLYHPNKEEIGQQVSTSPDVALAGKEEVAVQRGTLGYSARGKVPITVSLQQWQQLRGNVTPPAQQLHDGNIVVGEASVGIDIATIDEAQGVLIGKLLGLGALTLLAGLLATIVLWRLVRRSTLGLEPNELVDLVRDREAVLFAIREAAMTFDPAGTLTLANAHAKHMMFDGKEPSAQAVPQPVLDLVGGPDLDADVQVIDGKLVLLSHRRVERDGKFLGSVVTAIDRTDVQALVSELAVTKGLTNTLRAQRHEYANRDHLLRALLAGGNVAGAISVLAKSQEDAVTAIPHEQITDATLRGFLSAKVSLARESEVTLRLSEESNVSAQLRDHERVVTVLGNLIDNAITAVSCENNALADVAGPEKKAMLIEIDVLQDGADLVVSVCDSGPGIPLELQERVFERGFTTRGEAQQDHGFGLALALAAAREHGGDLWFTPDADPWGSVFVAKLPGVLRTELAEEQDEEERP